MLIVFVTLLLPACTVEPEPKSAVYTVTFNANNGTENTTRKVPEGSVISAPAQPVKENYEFGGWYADADCMDKWDFSTDTVTADITLYAKWSISITVPLTSTTMVALYLADKSGTQAEPAALPMRIDLGTMTQSSSGWQQLLIAIAAAGKHVALDLSACTMNGTEFDPDRTYVTGKDKIVSIVLPDTAISIADGANYFSTFNHFTALTSFSGDGLTTIGDYAFIYCTSLALTALPAGIIEIGTGAFAGCTDLALNSLPVSLTRIGNYAFQSCGKLALETLPANLTKIGDGIFYGCVGLTGMSLPTGITEFGIEVFRGCTNLARVSLPADMTVISEGTFGECTNLTEVSLPAGLAEIGNAAFGYCTNLALNSLPASLTKIGGGAFYACENLALTALPAGITSIDNLAFAECSNLALTSMPVNITEIPEGAFYHCTSLTEITLPTDITSIGERAFQYCFNIAQVICKAVTPPALGAGAFDGTGDGLVIKVPAAHVAAYQAAAGWKDYTIGVLTE